MKAETLNKEQHWDRQGTRHAVQLHCAQRPSPCWLVPDKTRSTGEGNGKSFPYSCLENPMNSMKRQKGRKLKDEPPRLLGAQYSTGVKKTNNYRKDEEAETKQKQC